MLGGGYGRSARSIDDEADLANVLANDFEGVLEYTRKQMDQFKAALKESPNRFRTKKNLAMVELRVCRAYWRPRSRRNTCVWTSPIVINW